MKSIPSITTWSKRAKCRLEGVYQEHLTKKYCTGCPVMGLCNTYALVHHERGIWGGMTEAERKRMDSDFVDVLTGVYQKQGLLENRSTDPLESLKHLAELQLVDTAPIAALVDDEDPNLDLSA